MKVLKCTVVGDPGIGKAALLKTYVTGEFPETCEPIIFDTFLTTPSVDGKDCQLSLWYTNGMEEFNKFRPLSYPGSNIILICFSLEFRTSLDNVVEKWFKEIQEYCPDIPILLVGLKQDLRQNFTQIRKTIQRNNSHKNLEILEILSESDDKETGNENEKAKGELVTVSEAEIVATKIRAIKYMEVSSLTKYNLSTLFEEVVRNAAPTPKIDDPEEESKGFSSCKGCVIS